jgi:hypothetical protein
VQQILSPIQSFRKHLNPINQAFDSEKANKLEGNQRIIFNKKLSHNK